MNKIKLTVALTTYNRPFYLKLALEAVLSQTFRDFELLVMDNASEPETELLVKSYHDDRIRYVRNKVNTREFVNEVWELASGEYLIITHDDDIMKNDMLEKELQILDNNAEIIGVSCNHTSIDDKGNIINMKVFPLDKPLMIKQFEYSHIYLDKCIYLIFPSMILRKSFFIEHGLKFELEVGPGADTYLWMKANLLPSSFYIIEEPLYCYRIHGNQDSIINNIQLKSGLYEALFNLFLGCENVSTFDKITKILLNEYIKNLYFHFMDKSTYIRKLNDLIGKLRSTSNIRLIFKSWLYKTFSFPVKTLYGLIYHKQIKA